MCGQQANRQGSNGSSSLSDVVAIDHHQTPRAPKAKLPQMAATTRSQSDRNIASVQNQQHRSPTGPQMQQENNETSYQSPPRPMFNRLSTLPDQRVLDDPDVKDRPARQWTIPKSSTGNSKGPRAATLFLGKDYERWQIHDRDNLGLGMKLGWNQRSGSSSALPSSSGGEYDEDDEEDYEEDYSDSFITDDESAATSSSRGSRRSSRRSSRSSRSRSGSGTWKRPGTLGSSLQPLTTADGGSPTATERIEQHLDRRRKSASTASSSGAGGQSSSPSRGSASPSGSGIFKPRRFSSNGPDAAFMRHETVIGLHTPRRDSVSSAASVGGRQLPAAFERISITPLSPATPRDPSPSTSRLASGQPSKLDLETAARDRAPSISDANIVALPEAAPSQPHGAAGKHKDAGQPSKGRDTLSRDVSSSDLLKRAAAAAAASVEPSSESDLDESGDARSGHESGASLEASTGDSGTVNGPLSHRSSSHSLGRSRSPAIALTLARRRKPIRLEGTLYDRSGPFREGAVTDGLSVRLFSAEKNDEGAGYADSGDEAGAGVKHNGHGHRHRNKDLSHRRNKSSSRRHAGVHRHEVDADKRALGQDSAIDDEEEPPSGNGDCDASVVPHIKDSGSATTYLITTPDNRVASAAKLRRWAMDGEGNFYAAMEIKSVEAKIRSAMDPADVNSSHSAAYARSLAKILRQTYLDDILNEVQKAETLNPVRKSVAKLLLTSDGKYLRLEEDYPEEAFFVIAGCEDHELYPVVALVFCETLRHIHRFHNAGWMHGDIKLENLMFDARGELVVIDYENANPFRIPGGDGCVALMSFDWVPPEAQAGPDGRRAGPSADLWALGANLVRAFALRDGIDDSYVRETLLESGQHRFLSYRDSLVRQKNPPRTRTRGEDIDLSPILVNAENLPPCDDPSDPNSLPTPQRVLLPFAKQAPHLLRFVLASCLTTDTHQRGQDAELDGLRLATELESERDGETMAVAKRAVETAIRLSGSEWVKPKLDEARRSLGLGMEDEMNETDADGY